MASAWCELRTWQGWVRRLAISGLITVSFVAVAAAAGQTVQQPGLPSASQPHAGLPSAAPADAPNPMAGPNASKLEHMREDERHKRLATDTAKLVELTNQLKEEVEKTSKDELSVDVVKKAAEIEKLAHDVKERMKS